MKSLTGNKGFTLIEMFIALVILALAMLALAGLMVATTKNNSFGGHVTEAATFAQDKLEEFQTAPWNSIGDPNQPTSDQRFGFDRTTAFRRSWAVVTSADGNLKTVTLNVNWTDRTDHSIRLIFAINKKD